MNRTNVWRGLALGLVLLVPASWSAPKVNSIKLVQLADITATLRVSCCPTSTQYAVMEGVWNPAAAMWRSIGTERTVWQTFETSLELTATTGVHTVSLAVRDAFGASSPAKAVKVTVKGPQIARVSPTSGQAGDRITISGKGFGAPAIRDGGQAVFFGEAEAEVETWSDTSILAWLPAAATSGTVGLVVRADSGLQSRSRPFRVNVPWSGVWTGSYECTYDTDVSPQDPLVYGRLIATLQDKGGGAVQMVLASGEKLTGMVVGEALQVAGPGRNGTACTLTGTVTSTTMVGTFRVEKGSWYATHGVTMQRPGERLRLSGVYVLEECSQWDSESKAARRSLGEIMLLDIRQNGSRVSARRRVHNDSFTGTVEGEVFVVPRRDGGVSARLWVDRSAATGTVASGFEGTNEWFDPEDDDRGWDTVEATRSSGTSGLADGVTDWTLTFASDETGEKPGTAVATVQGTKLTLVVGEGEEARKLVGEVYDGAFVVKGGPLVVQGRIADGAMDARFRYETATDHDQGTVTGQLVP